MTLLAFLVALGVLITVHEWAHYRVAVASGVKVLTFSVGFGKPLLRWKSRRPHPGQDTEFVIGLIPLGGYVRMLDEAEGDVPLPLAHRAFNRQSLRVRSAIVAAGPLANVLLAVLLYACIALYGQHQTRAIVSTPLAGSVAHAAGVQSGDEVLRVGESPESLKEVNSLEDLRWWLMGLSDDVTQVWWEVQPQGVAGKKILTLKKNQATDESASDTSSEARRVTWALADLGIQGPWTAPVLGELQPGQPAQKAGLSRGDVVLRIDGQKIHDAAMLRQSIRDSGAQGAPRTQVWEVQRRQHGVLMLEVTPEWVSEAGRQHGRIGAHVGGAALTHWVQLGVVESVRHALERTWDMAAMTLQMLAKMVVGQASWDNLSGPITMADYAGKTASLGLTAYLSYLAVLSVSLGVFNLLPVPMLDGGHLMYYLYEAISGRPVSLAVQGFLQRFGLAVLMALMAVSFFNDVMRLGWLN